MEKIVKYTKQTNLLSLNLKKINFASSAKIVALLRSSLGNFSKIRELAEEEDISKVRQCIVKMDCQD